ncbi:MAG: SDR family oxidoreductase [Candidatus Promineofilum sp.]|nr:SDR family oxidoreductase [Promineifilum sp.]
MKDRPVAVVTGASGGIGAASVTRLIKDGYFVYGLDLHVRASDIDTQRYISVDISDRSACLEAFSDIRAETGRIDCLVTCAMKATYGSMESMEEEAIDTMFDIGFKGTYWAIQGAIPAMKATRNGSIITFSSIAASVSIKNATIYSAVKGAISALTVQAAIELAPHNIRVNAVAPGPVKTPLTRSLHDEEAFALRLSRSPLGFLQETDGIADVVAYLASNQSRTVTGQVLTADGGLSVYAL